MAFYASNRSPDFDRQSIRSSDSTIGENIGRDATRPHRHPAGFRVLTLWRRISGLENEAVQSSSQPMFLNGLDRSLKRYSSRTDQPSDADTISKMMWFSRLRGKVKPC